MFTLLLGLSRSNNIRKLLKLKSEMLIVTLYYSAQFSHRFMSGENGRQKKRKNNFALIKTFDSFCVLRSELVLLTVFPFVHYNEQKWSFHSNFKNEMDGFYRFENQSCFFNWSSPCCVSNDIVYEWLSNNNNNKLKLI